MDESNNSRRGFIRGITLAASSIFLVTVCRGVGATEAPQAKTRKIKPRGATTHFMEGNHLPIPVHNLGTNTANGDQLTR
jgi:hypothetical protein